MGERYNIVTKFGHSILPIYPETISLKVEDNFLKLLAGISLENILILYKTKKTKKKLVLEEMY